MKETAKRERGLYVVGGMRVTRQKTAGSGYSVPWAYKTAVPVGGIITILAVSVTG